MPVLWLLLTLFCNVAFAQIRGQEVKQLLAHYSDEQIGKLESFSLPRTFLYDAQGELIDPGHWPPGLAQIKDKIGNAECCVDDGTGPCVPQPFTPAIDEHFSGLLDASGAQLQKTGLPAHQWLIVQYHASWCPPCVVETAELRKFFESSSDREAYLWLKIDMSRLPEAQEAHAARTGAK